MGPPVIFPDAVGAAQGFRLCFAAVSRYSDSELLDKHGGRGHGSKPGNQRAPTPAKHFRCLSTQTRWLQWEIAAAD